MSNQNSSTTDEPEPTFSGMSLSELNEKIEKEIGDNPEDRKIHEIFMSLDDDPSLPVTCEIPELLTEEDKKELNDIKAKALQYGHVYFVVNNPCKILITSLATKVTRDELMGYFDKISKVKNVIVQYNGLTKKPQGRAFVYFEKPEGVEKAFSVERHELRGKVFNLSRATIGENDFQSKVIFVTKQGGKASEKELREYFRTLLGSDRINKIFLPSLIKPRKSVLQMDELTKVIEPETSRNNNDFAFISFNSSIFVDKLLKLKNLHINGQEITIHKAFPRHSKENILSEAKQNGATIYSVSEEILVQEANSYSEKLNELFTEDYVVQLNVNCDYEAQEMLLNDDEILLGGINKPTEFFLF